MRHFSSFFSCCLFVLWGSAALNAQTIYVKGNATGLNNGSSWADAFSSLEPALLAAQPGQDIWVATGTYRPDSTVNPLTKDFLLQSGVNLWGGFAGTETALSQRKPDVYVTILSGDQKGNDVIGDFSLNRGDNSLHILRVENGDPNNRSIVDGFRFMGGNTLTTSTDNTQTRGGAIIALAKLTVRNCYFTDNFANSGIVTANGPLSSGILVDGCLFERNRAASSAAGVSMLSVTEGQVNNCSFRQNDTNRGCVYIDNSSGTVVDSCLFESNKTLMGQNFGAAMFTWQSDYAVSNCVFKENETYNAIAYNDGRNGGRKGTWDNCLFEGNKASNFGAGLYNWQANLTVRNCTFRNNTAPSAASFYANANLNNSSYTIENSTFETNSSTDFGGGAIYNNTAKFNVRKCLFKGNTSVSSASAVYNRVSQGSFYGCTFEANNARYGGAISNYTGDRTTYDSCFFKVNKAANGGGAMHNGFKSATVVKRCTFEENTAIVGAALGIQNDSTSLTVLDSRFLANNAENAGGGIGGYTAGVSLTVRNSFFEANSSETGGAIHISEDSLNLSRVIVERTEFRENLGFTQGAAVNLLNADAEFTNCLFASNLNLGTGAGGGMSVNAARGDHLNLKTLNCTFGNNDAVIGAGVALYEDPATSSKVEWVLQNTIFANLSDNFAIEEGKPSVRSQGGNLSDDATLATYLTSANDLNDTDPLFVDPEQDFRLQIGSPAINQGIADGAPTQDITGATRIGLPDMGAYEFLGSPTREPAPLALRLSPNPAAHWLHTTL
ncbi:MAG TPA: right-handed parallel beta-helix repeat-containing protein, partial [Saprospiraceae bacterium]|nr:right-handed parallel beta-helix repeat-containing protein [Saprospiraceae bacterium]